MCSMAVSDIGLVTVAWLASGVGSMHHTWIYGLFMCKLMPYSQAMAGDSSMWTIAIVGIDRFVQCCLVGYISDNVIDFNNYI
jgi:hypothetical protein